MTARWDLCVPVLRAGPGVCDVCHGPAAASFDRCFCCVTAARALGTLAPVAAVSVYRIPSPLHTVLRGYKEAPVAAARGHFGRRVIELLGAFLDRHGSCLADLAGGAITLAVPVPPTIRKGPSPMCGVGERLRARLEKCAAGCGIAWSPDVLRRGGAEMDHLRPAPDGYVVPASMRERLCGRRVVVLDDTLTTGSRAQSAAAALRSAGAAAVVILVVGRVVRPDAAVVESDYWRRAVQSAFSPDRCCLDRCRRGRPSWG